jgi:hypothetical protein
MTEKVFVFPSSELEALLETKGSSIDEILAEAGFSSGTSTNPAHEGESATKEPVSIILASAGIIMAATPSISKIIQALLRRSLVVEEMVLVPVEDSAGKVVNSALGEPMTHWVSKKRLLDQAVIPLKTSVSIEGPVGLKLSLKED